MAEGLCALCLAVLGLEAKYCGPVLPVGVGSGEISRGEWKKTKEPAIIADFC